VRTGQRERAAAGAGRRTTREWRSAVLPRQGEALIAAAYLAGANTRRVGRARGARFRGAVGTEVVSRTWRRGKTDGDAWNRRALAGADIVRLILDGTGGRLERKATRRSRRVGLGIHGDGPKGRRSVRTMGGEREAAGRAGLDALVVRGRKPPQCRIMDAAGLERALALGPTVPTQRWIVDKPRNLPAHAPEKPPAEITADCTAMIYADSVVGIAPRRRAFLRQWRVTCRADSLEEAGDRLFASPRLPPRQWKSARTTNAIARLHEEFRRRIKTQTVLPSAETAAMWFWALPAAGQITMRKVAGWQSLAEPPMAHPPIDLAA
jgi:putative transposase